MGNASKLMPSTEEKRTLSESKPRNVSSVILGWVSKNLAKCLSHGNAELNEVRAKEQFWIVQRATSLFGRSIVRETNEVKRRNALCSRR